MTMQDCWQQLHTQDRFRPKYPNEEVARFVFAHLKPSLDLSRAKVLDLGCGGGRHTLLLAREGFTTFGVDFSLSGLHSTASRLNEENLHAALVQADMHRLPFHNGSFDALVAVGSIYYTDWQGMQQVAHEIYRVLRKGSLAFILVRTQKDCRFGMGLQIDSKSFLLNDNKTNEKGMKNCFLSENDVHTLFAEFNQLSIDICDFTLGNREIVNSDWVIVVKK